MTAVDHSLHPLIEIERAVQARAKDLALDLSAPDADQALRALIDDEVARWSLDFKRGLRPHELATPDVMAERAFRNLAGYGPLATLLDDDDVWEIMINAPDGTCCDQASRAPRGNAGHHRAKRALLSRRTANRALRDEAWGRVG